MMGLTMVQMWLNGRRLSREKAKTVRPRACMAVKHTNWIMMRANTVNAMPPLNPREL